MSETEKPAEPIPVPEELRTFVTNFRVLPADTNYHPPMIFGGKMASEIDLCCAGLVTRLVASCGGENNIDTAVTANMNIRFVGPAKQGDIVYITARLAGFGRKSIMVDFVAEAENMKDPCLKRNRVSEGRLVFCTVAMVDEKSATIAPVAHGLYVDAEKR